MRLTVQGGLRHISCRASLSEILLSPLLPSGIPAGELEAQEGAQHEM